MPRSGRARLRLRNHRDPSPLSATQLVESFFRHEYSRVVAMLARRVGMADIALVEDAVQSTMMLALERWKVAGVPDQPTA